MRPCRAWCAVALPPMAGSQPAYAVVARSTWHAQQAARALPSGLAAAGRWRVDSDAIARDFAASGPGGARERRGLCLCGSRRCRHHRPQRAACRGCLHRTLPGPRAAGAHELHGPGARWAGHAPGCPRRRSAIPAAARAVGVAPEAVTVHVTYLGGGFGRRLDVDYAAQAARVALECSGAPAAGVVARGRHDARLLPPRRRRRDASGPDAQGRPGPRRHACGRRPLCPLAGAHRARAHRAASSCSTARPSSTPPASPPLRQPQDAPGQGRCRGHLYAALCSTRCVGPCRHEERACPLPLARG